MESYSEKVTDVWNSFKWLSSHYFKLTTTALVSPKQNALEFHWIVASSGGHKRYCNSPSRLCHLSVKNINFLIVPNRSGTVVSYRDSLWSIFDQAARLQISTAPTERCRSLQSGRVWACFPYFYRGLVYRFSLIPEGQELLEGKSFNSYTTYAFSYLSRVSIKMC